MAEARTFLEALFQGAPEHAAIQLWGKKDKRTHYYAVGLMEHAVSHVDRTQDTDLYVAAGLGSKVMKPNKARVPNHLIAAIPGIWADIDINGGPEGKQGAAPDMKTARELAHSLLDPTLIVSSGYGIQAWWLFEGGPWVFGPGEREQAARLVRGFQAALRAQAKERGFGLDSTHDLARLMRVPGARNHKGADSGHTPQPVTIIAFEEDRYTVDDIGVVAQNHMDVKSENVQRITGEGLGIELRGASAKPSWQVGQLLGADVDFKNMWDRRKVGRAKEWSNNSFDLSIATRLADAGCDDQEIADALVFNRREHGDPQNKTERMDYIKSTIAKAKLRSDLAEIAEEQERIQSDAQEQLEAIAVDGATSEPERTVSLFTQLLGGPEVKELVQDSRDPDQARFRLVLADGSEVPLGSGADFLNADKFRAAFAVVTGYVVTAVKRDKWHKVVQALLHAATINEDEEDTRSSRGKSLVRDYAERGLSNDKDAACQVHDPFTHGGEVFIPLAPLAQYLRRVRSERLVDADIKQLLIAAGFERKTINYFKENGKKSSRSYWVADATAMDLLEV